MPNRSNNYRQQNSLADERRVQALQLGIVSPDAIHSMSVAEIKSTQIYDVQTFQPNFHAINDPRMGVMDRDSLCYTCKAGMDNCPGHFGHINLNSPVYHPGFLVYIAKFLRCVCYNCSRLLLKGSEQKILDDRDALLKIKNPKIRFKTLYKLTDGTQVCDPTSGGCGFKQPKIKKGSLKIEVEFRDENFDKTRDRKGVLWPEEALRVLERIKVEDCKLMGLNPEVARPDWTILRVFAVAPPPVRPSVSLGAGMRSEDDLTFGYQQVLKLNALLNEQLEKGANQTILNELKTSLQYYVSTIMDNKIAGQPIHKHKSGKPIKCIRSRLKGKEGRLRGNLMGKRVDFSARTVITPDPNLALDQLGVPYGVAQGLTVPETVTAHNFEKLRKLVLRGPNEWPGAKYIIRHDQRQVDLSMVRCLSDQHLEPGYVVERHLQDGDLVLFNRQPSLHKMSIMGHRVKVLPHLTFRMNLSVTTPYNADFDGDEMNMHVPQSFESMAEIKELMAVPKQILAPQANKPCMGIVQDSLLGSLLMTSRDSFIDKDTAMQLIMWMPNSSNNGDVMRLPQPAILKPKPLWTGKQIFSQLIPRVNLSRVKDNQYCCPKDSFVYIESGELLCGALNKSIIGSTGQGLGHLICKDFGVGTCADFLSGVQKVINQWIIFHGFTVGVQDIIVQEKQVADGIQNILTKYKRQVSKIISKSQLGKLKSQPGKTMQESFEVSVNKKLNDARDKSGNLALDGLVSSNRLRNMVIAGSKGSNINISQIMACVGQQNVEGGRIPFGFNRRTLPHFSKDDFGPESKGFVESSYLKGLNPEELYFHAMGGREGLIDTAVKTAETGYISRRLIKALEDVMVQYDGTVRTSKHEILQFLYGEDGMAGEHIEDLQIEVLKQSNKDLAEKCMFPERGSSEIVDQVLEKAFDFTELNSLGQADQIEAITQEYKAILADREVLRKETFRHSLDDQVHLPVNVARLIWNAKSQFGIPASAKTQLTPKTVVSKLNTLISGLNVINEAQQRPNQILVDANLNAKLLFSMQLRHKLCSKNVILNERLSPLAFDWLCAEIKSKFEQSVVRPGEMVGSLAAQSLGEPATQMTLNTFHFAGISSKNVTLGVPRFKEIINVNKNIKTPGLKIYLQEDQRTQEKKVSKIGMAIEWTTLCHVVSQSAIYYDPDPERTIIPEDKLLVQLYNDVPVIEDQVTHQRPNPWLLRLVLDKEKMGHKGLRMSAIDKKLSDTFKDQISIMVSDDNSEKHVIRIRLNGVEDDESQTVAAFMKNEFEPSILNELALKGLPEITKVTFQKLNEPEVDQKTGKIKMSEDRWLIETDGSALFKVLAIPKVDAHKTISNDNLEVLQVLGVEAARQSIINEMRFVFSSYGIYVNYRHICTLVDVMSLRGRLTSITRSGINRVDSGVLRKCTFEETVEILLEGAIFAERDNLSGISENVIMGQLGPFGSGSFGITLDPQVIEENSRSQFGLAGQLDLLSEYEQGYDTPMNPDDPGFSGTPMIGLTPFSAHNTPNMAGATTPYNAAMTPIGMGGAFSPKLDGMYGNFDSPGYASPSPFYGNQSSPMMNRSPVYGLPRTGQVVSPIYNQGAAGPGGVQSPNYMQSIGGPQSPVYNNRQQSPAYRADGGGQAAHNPYSPVYSGQSPVYSNPSLAQPFAQTLGMQSPSYSPGQTSLPNQNYKPSFYSPSYSPASAQGSIGASAGGENISAHNTKSGQYYLPPQTSSPQQMGNSAPAPQFKQEPAYDPTSSPTYAFPVNVKIEPSAKATPAYSKSHDANNQSAQIKKE